MSVTSVSGTSAATTQAANRPDPMTDVAKLLNMSTSDVRSALKSGSSLSDLASKQGVSRDDLLNTIESDLKNRPARPGGSTDGTGSTDDLAAEAAKIADTKGLPQHHGHHHHGGSGSVSSTSSLTPTTSDASTVSSQLSAGGSVDVTL